MHVEEQQFSFGRLETNLFRAVESTMLNLRVNN